MKLIIGGRQSGKTTHLIKESAKTGKVIITFNAEHAKHVLRMANDMEVKIPQPVPVGNLQSLRGNRNARDMGVLIDEFEYVLYELLGVHVRGFTMKPPKDTVTLDKYSIYGLRKDNNYVEVVYENIPYSEVEPTLEALQKDNSDIYIRFFKGLYQQTAEI